LGWERERSCVGEDGIGALGWRSACGWIWLGGSSSRKGLEESLWMDLARWELEQEGIGGSSVLWREGIREGCACGALERRFWGAAAARSSGISAAGRVWWQPEARARRQAAAAARRHGGGARRHGAEPSGIGVERSCGGSAGSAGWSAGGAKEADALQFPCSLLVGLG